MLWLWCRLAATVPIRPLAWETPCASSVALEKTHTQKSILANQIQPHIKRIINHEQVRFIPGKQEFFSIYTSISVTYHKLKDKNDMMISIDTKKNLTKFNTNL